MGPPMMVPAAMAPANMNKWIWALRTGTWNLLIRKNV